MSTTFPRPESPTKSQSDSRPSSRSSFTPSSPTKHRPNPHPYAIKTTTTGILSRSSTAPAPAAVNAPYYYVPPSPTKSERILAPVRGKNGSTKGRHRYSRSLTAEEPRPLPVPPAMEAGAFEPQGRGVGGRPRRADTLPATPVFAAQAELAELNPKEWDSAQLAAFLSESDVLAGAWKEETITFVREREIGGQGFMRLDNGVLDAYAVPKEWRTSLLSAARALKQRVLKRRIWPGDSNTFPRGSDTDTPPANTRHSNAADLGYEDHAGPFARGRGPFTSYTRHERGEGEQEQEQEQEDLAYLSSSSTSYSSVSSTASSPTSSVLSSHPADADGIGVARRHRVRPRRARDGRVQGIVAGLERSGSVSPTRDGMGEGRAGSASPTRGGEGSPTRHSVYSPSASMNGGRPLPFPPAAHQYQDPLQVQHQHQHHDHNHNHPHEHQPPLLLPRHADSASFLFDGAEEDRTGGGGTTDANTNTNTNADVGGAPFPLDGAVPVQHHLAPFAAPHATGAAHDVYAGAGTQRGRGWAGAVVPHGTGEGAYARPLPAPPNGGFVLLAPGALAGPGGGEVLEGARAGAGVGARAGAEEEMSVEELLALEGKGASAWEMDLGLGETVKRVPGRDTTCAAGAGAGAGPAVVFGRSRGRAAREGTQRRGVVGVFGGEGGGRDAAPVDVSAVDVGVGEVGARAEVETMPEVKTMGTDPDVGPSDSDNDAIGRALLESEVEDTDLDAKAVGPGDGDSDAIGRALLESEVEDADLDAKAEEEARDTTEAEAEAEAKTDRAVEALEAGVAATRAAVEAFRVRLEGVERAVGEMEVRLGEREREEEEGRRRREEEEEERRQREMEERKKDAGVGAVMLDKLRMLALAAGLKVPEFGVADGIDTAGVWIRRAWGGDAGRGGDAGATDAGGSAVGARTDKSRGRERQDARAVRRARFGYGASPISRYILLVGIGMCAFVLRGLVRRVWAVGVGVRTRRR